MDRHPQQIKRERQDIKRRARNVDALSKLRTNVKKVLAATNKKEAELIIEMIFQLGIKGCLKFNNLLKNIGKVQIVQ